MSATTTAVRRPAFSVEAGDGAASDWASLVVTVAVELGAAPVVNAATVVAALRSDTPGVAVGDDAVVGLGFEDASTDTLLTGTVAAVTLLAGGRVRIAVVDGGAALAALRVNKSYDGQSAGAVVRDLASEASVSTGTIENGVDLPFYVADDRRSAYGHTAFLAGLNGFWAYVTPAGELAFGTPPAGLPAASFTHGEDVVAFAGTTVPALGEVTAIGEGAAGSEGADAWCWLLKDPSAVTATSGSGTPARRFSSGALRSRDAAAAAAEGVAGAAYSEVATAVVPGTPEAVVGATLDFAGGDLAGSYLVRGARHTLSRAGGFVSRLDLVSASGGLGGLF